MLLQKKKTIEEVIVQTLSKRSNMTVTDLMRIIIDSGLSYSQRGIYKELLKLEKNGIVIKTKNTYNLDLSWIIQAHQLIEAAYKTYSDVAYLEKTLNLSGKKITHTFSDLLKMDHYWIQILIALHKIYPEEPLFLWCPYQWFNLAQNYNLENFYSASDTLGAKRYHIFGADNFLNRLALSQLPKHGIYSFTGSPFSQEMNTYYSIIGDYLITVIIDEHTTAKFHHLFNSVTSKKELSTYNLNFIFGQNSKIKISIEKSNIKCNKLKKKFFSHFNLN